MAIMENEFEFFLIKLFIIVYFYCRQRRRQDCEETVRLSSLYHPLK